MKAFYKCRQKWNPRFHSRTVVQCASTVVLLCIVQVPWCLGHAVESSFGGLLLQGRRESCAESSRLFKLVIISFMAVSGVSRVASVRHITSTVALIMSRDVFKFSRTVISSWLKDIGDLISISAFCTHYFNFKKSSNIMT